MNFSSAPRCSSAFGVVHLLAAAQVVDRLVDGAFHGAAVLQHAAERALVLAGREHEQFARDVLVAALLRELVGDVEEFQEVVRGMHLARRAFHRRDAADLLEQARAQQVHVDAGAIEQRARAAAFLVEQREQQVHRLDELVIAADRERLRIRQRELEFRRQPILSHRGAPGCVPARWMRPAGMDSTRQGGKFSAIFNGLLKGCSKGTVTFKGDCPLLCIALKWRRRGPPPGGAAVTGVEIDC